MDDQFRCRTSGSAMDATMDVACEDLRFFERRLTEVIASMHPSASRWRVILIIVFLSTVYSSYYWITDPSIRTLTLCDSLRKHVLFSLSFPCLLLLFVICGIHKRVVAPSIIASRCRQVLADFSLSCDDGGKLIVRPANRPHNTP